MGFCLVLSMATVWNSVQESVKEESLTSIFSTVEINFDFFRSPSGSKTKTEVNQIKFETVDKYQELEQRHISSRKARWEMSQRLAHTRLCIERKKHELYVHAVGGKASGLWITRSYWDRMNPRWSYTRGNNPWSCVLEPRPVMTTKQKVFPNVQLTTNNNQVIWSPKWRYVFKFSFMCVQMCALHTLCLLLLLFIAWFIF